MTSTRSEQITAAPAQLPAAVPCAVRTSGRVRGLDAFRGLAVLLMLADHLLLVADGPDVLRSTVTRVCMPMFFLLAGHLASRPRARHAGVALLGLLLPVAVPWIDAPNVLVWWAVGVLVLWAGHRLGVPSWLWIALALTGAANGWANATGYYDPAALLGLMALGSLLPRSVFTWADCAPGWVASIGRHPVAWYVGHLLVLQALVLAVGGGV